MSACCGLFGVALTTSANDDAFTDAEAPVKPVSSLKIGVPDSVDAVTVQSSPVSAQAPSPEPSPTAMLAFKSRVRSASISQEAMAARNAAEQSAAVHKAAALKLAEATEKAAQSALKLEKAKAFSALATATADSKAHKPVKAARAKILSHLEDSILAKVLNEGEEGEEESEEDLAQKAIAEADAEAQRIQMEELLREEEEARVALEREKALANAAMAAAAAEMKRAAEEAAEAARMEQTARMLAEQAARAEAQRQAEAQRMEAAAREALREAEEQAANLPTAEREDMERLADVEVAAMVPVPVAPLPEDPIIAVKAMLLPGLNIVKHSRNGKSVNRQLVCDEQFLTVTWGSEDFTVSKVLEVRRGDEPDPTAAGQFGTPTLRKAKKGQTSSTSMSLVFSDRTVDITCSSEEECNKLIAGFRAAIK